jgi:hypothetical protein
VEKYNPVLLPEMRGWPILAVLVSTAGGTGQRVLGRVQLVAMAWQLLRRKCFYEVSNMYGIKTSHTIG